MADAPASIESIYRVTHALERSSVPYAFIGGVAVIAWGVPRATFDLDVALTVSPEGATRLLRALDEQGFVVDEVFLRGYRDRLAEMEKIQIQMPVGRTLLTIDVFFESTPFLRSVLSRRVAAELGRGPVSICTSADLILFKLVAWRRKDRVDIENVLTIQGVPEREYLERWAGELGVRDRLDQALAEFEARG